MAKIDPQDRLKYGVQGEATTWGSRWRPVVFALAVIALILLLTFLAARTDRRAGGACPDTVAGPVGC